MAAALLLLHTAPLFAELPSGGRISAGSGGISQSGSQMVVHQASDRLAVNWQSFSIGPDSRVTFEQPSASAIALNRVLGPDPSSIQGRLQSNGQVFLLNPNGVLFSPTAQVEVGGLVASTLDLDDRAFLSGRYRFQGESSAAVKNQGRIQAAEGGAVAMIAARVINEGRIDAPGGAVLMGSGSRVTLDLGGPVPLSVEKGVLEGLIEQGAVAAGNTADYHVNAPINLAATGSFSTRLGSNGAEVGYTIIDSLGIEGSASGADLQGMRGNLNHYRNYALGADINASSTSGWNAGAGFAPVGDSPTPFPATFDGMNYAIDGLFIDRPTTNYVGLFGSTKGATLQNVGLTGVDITGQDYVGAVVGRASMSGRVANNRAEGLVTGRDDVGGLVGSNDLSIPILNSSADVAVSGRDYVGGLISASLDINRVLTFGDQLTFGAMLTDERLWYGRLGYSLPLGPSGLRARAEYLHTDYELGADFASLGATGDMRSAKVGVQYPWVRSLRSILVLALDLDRKLLNDRPSDTVPADDKRSTVLPFSVQFDHRDDLGGEGLTWGVLTWTPGRLRLDRNLRLVDGLTARSEGDFNRWNLELARVQQLPGAFALFGRLAQAELRYQSGVYAPFLFLDAGEITLNADPWAPGPNERYLAGGGLGLRIAWGAGRSTARRPGAGRVGGRYPIPGIKVPGCGSAHTIDSGNLISRLTR